MSITEIQNAVDALAPEERKRLTAWMVSKYSIRSVEQLMRCATELVEAGTWTPSPPTNENRPGDKAAAHAREVAERLDLER